MTSKEARKWDEGVGITPQREGAVPQYVGPKGRYEPQMPEFTQEQLDRSCYGRRKDVIEAILPDCKCDACLVQAPINKCVVCSVEAFGAWHSKQLCNEHQEAIFKLLDEVIEGWIEGLRALQ